MSKSTSVAIPPNTEKTLGETGNPSILSPSDVSDCPICHNILTASVQIPSHYIFCSLCILFHLNCKSACPYLSCCAACSTVSVSPLRDCDRSFASRIALHQRLTANPPQKTLPALPLLGAESSQNLVQHLCSVGLSTSGSGKTLTKRYKEYALRATSAADSAFPTSTQGITDVRQHDKALHAPPGMNSFFTAPYPKVAPLSKALPLTILPNRPPTVSENENVHVLILICLLQSIKRKLVPPNLRSPSTSRSSKHYEIILFARRGSIR